MSDQKTKEYYDTEAWRYDRTHGAGKYGAQYSIRTHYLPFWKRYLRKSDHILEIGCGTGVFTQQLRKLCRSITAVDLSPKMAEQARRRNPGVDIRMANAERLPFAKGKFDAVVCVNSFSYVLNQRKALREIRRVLKPKGKALLVEPNLRCPAYWVMYFTRHRRVGRFFSRFRRSTPEKIRTLLEANGFRVQECYGGNFVPHGTGVLRAGLFIPLDKTLGKTVGKEFGMRVFCAAVRK